MLRGMGALRWSPSTDASATAARLLALYALLLHLCTMQEAAQPQPARSGGWRLFSAKPPQTFDDHASASSGSATLPSRAQANVSRVLDQWFRDASRVCRDRAVNVCARACACAYVQGVRAGGRAGMHACMQVRTRQCGAPRMSSCTACRPPLAAWDQALRRVVVRRRHGCCFRSRASEQGKRGGGHVYPDTTNCAGVCECAWGRSLPAISILQPLPDAHPPPPPAPPPPPTHPTRGRPARPQASGARP